MDYTYLGLSLVHLLLSENQVADMDLAVMVRRSSCLQAEDIVDDLGTEGVLRKGVGRSVGVALGTGFRRGLVDSRMVIQRESESSVLRLVELVGQEVRMDCGDLVVQLVVRGDG